MLSEFRQIKIDKWIPALFTFLFFVLLFITAWLSDDAYITFRTIDNFISGFGLTWNAGERVQTFTHPLWMFVLSLFYFLTREFYFTSIFLSITISLAAFYLLIRKISVSVYNTIITGLILIFSKAFVDYSTSGLENPLTHLLIVLFFTHFLNDEQKKNKLLQLSVLASLAALNRLDIILIFIPPLFYVYFQENKKVKNLFILLAGFAPLIFWEIFSLFYYGFPFPNTAYAKLNTGINQSELIQQGANYFLDSLCLDPLTVFVLIFGIILVLIKRKSKLDLIAMGIVLYIFYIINIGGDFMSGRFISSLLLCSVLILARIEINSLKTVFVFSFLIVGLGFLSPRPNILSTPYYSLGPKIIHAFRFGPLIKGINNGITDERFWYYENTGLLKNLSQNKVEKHPWVEHALAVKSANDKLVVKATVGLFGFYAGRDVHIVDQYALTDPLLARLPSTEYWLIGKEKPEDEKFWRIGHFARKIPEGYLESLKSGKNKIADHDLAKYYDKLSIIIKGGLWDWNRLKEIWNFNTGEYNYLLDSYSKTLNIKN